VRAKPAAVVLALVAAVYFVLLGGRGVVMIASGRPVGIALGVGVLVVPLVCAWAVWRELRFGRATEVLARELEAQDGLPVDDLPRTPGGRIQRAAADEAFGRYREETDAAPQDWRSWFRLACAYDAAGDRRRARRAMRHAVELHG
jgi:hypothetical protein